MQVNFMKSHVSCFFTHIRDTTMYAIVFDCSCNRNSNSTMKTKSRLKQTITMTLVKIKSLYTYIFVKVKLAQTHQRSRLVFVLNNAQKYQNTIHTELH